MQQVGNIFSLREIFELTEECSNVGRTVASFAGGEFCSHLNICDYCKILYL
jgi:hypothetical protein